MSLPTGIPVAVPQATLLQSACGSPFPPAYILLHPQPKCYYVHENWQAALAHIMRGERSRIPVRVKLRPAGGLNLNCACITGLEEDIRTNSSHECLMLCWWRSLHSLRDTMYCMYSVLNRSLIYSSAPGIVCSSLEMCFRLWENAPQCWYLEKCTQKWLYNAFSCEEIMCVNWCLNAIIDQTVSKDFNCVGHKGKKKKNQHFLWDTSEIRSE